jgi:hypothetical protein
MVIDFVNNYTIQCQLLPVSMIQNSSIEANIKLAFNSICFNIRTGGEWKAHYGLSLCATDRRSEHVHGGQRVMTFLWTSTIDLVQYHWRASRGALWAWSGWAFSEIHGPRHYKPDHGPHYEPGGQLRNRAAGPSGQWPPVLIRTDGADGHRGPAPLEPPAGVMSRPLHCWGPDSQPRYISPDRTVWAD